jgi:hypothetical protein
MRWKTKPLPKVGDRMETERFAWRPIECSHGITVWLEWVTDTWMFLGMPVAEWNLVGTLPRDVNALVKREIEAQR